MNKNQSLDQIKEIKDLMERSVKFISLSGISGVFIGLIAISGIALFAFQSDINIWAFEPLDNYTLIQNREAFVIDLSLILFFSIAISMGLTIQNSKKKGEAIWGQSAKRLLINMAIPLGIGFYVCLVLIKNDLDFLIAPLTHVFYGLALINASKYTLNDIRFLGLFQLLCGMIALYFHEYALLIWMFGFGILHMVYGLIMHKKYA